MRRLISFVAAALIGLIGIVMPVQAQDLEPRRWSQLPTGVNFFGAGIGYSEGDIFLDPVLQIEDASVELSIAGISYVRRQGLMDPRFRLSMLLYVRSRSQVPTGADMDTIALGYQTMF